MKLGIHFYGKTQIAILIHRESSEGLPDHDLQLFAWFALRQLKNLSHHPVGDVCAGILTDSSIVDEIFNGKTPALKTTELLRNTLNAKFAGKFGSEYTKESVKLAILGQMGNPLYDTIDREILSTFPQLIVYPGKPGDKRFHVTLPPGILEMKGFGILGSQINYCVCHSIIAMIKFLGRQRAGDETFLKRMCSIGYDCCEVHMRNLISNSNQRELASQFVKASQ